MSTIKKNAKIFEDIILLTLPFIPLFLYYVPIFQCPWWGGDDPCIVLTIKKFGITGLLFNDKAWQDLTPVNFTPWLPISIGFDLKLFGFHPLGFFIHQLLSGILFIFIFIFSLKKKFSLKVLSLTLILFLPTTPAKEVFTALSTRHYLEGLIFSLSSIYLFEAFWDGNNRKKLFISIFFYFLACMAKEIFIFLPLLLFINHMKHRKALKSIFFFGVPLTIYTLWRIYCLSPSGSIHACSGIFPPINLKTILYIPKLFQKASRLPLYLFIIISIFTLHYIFRNKIKSILIILLTIIPILPVLTIAKYNSRYFLLACLFFSLAAACELNFIIDVYIIPKTNNYPKKIIFFSAYTMAFVVITVFMAKKIKWEYNFWARARLEGMFIYEPHINPENNNLLYDTLAPSWHFNCLAKLRKNKKGPQFCDPDIKFAACVFPDAFFWKYKNGNIIKDNCQCNKNDLKTHKKLDIKIYYDISSRKTMWKFGPYKDGQYHIFFIDNKRKFISSLPLSYEGSFSFNTWFWDRPEQNVFAVKFVSEKGWVVYSDLLSPVNSNGYIIWKN